MAALIDAGASVEAIAARFGVSQRHVTQRLRLRLGKLAPELLDAYRETDVSLSRRDNSASSNTLTDVLVTRKRVTAAL